MKTTMTKGTRRAVERRSGVLTVNGVKRYLTPATRNREAALKMLAEIGVTFRDGKTIVKPI